MKLKIKKSNYLDVLSIKPKKRKLPKKPLWILRKLMYMLSFGEVKSCNVKFIEKNLENLPKGQNCLILMNHSCFLDLKIAQRYFKKKPLSIVCTTDGFIGKEKFMRYLGCIPTNKFQADVTLIKDISYALKNIGNVIVYPEATYSHDGTASVIPDSVGKLIKFLKVPIISVITKGAYLHDPLYNNLQLRKVDVVAEVNYLISPKDAEDLPVDKLNQMLRDVFTFDNFKYQQENKLKIDAPFRADGLHRVLYKCPHCQKENMEGKGIELTCKECGKTYTLDEYGYLVCKDAKFNHVPDWFKWQQDQVKKEIEKEEYSVDIPVKIGVIRDYKAFYMVGDGMLHHDKDGFRLTGDGIDYFYSTKNSFTLNVDFFWYELGDVISFGEPDLLFYCFPKDNFPVTKARMAVEELYKLNR